MKLSRRAKRIKRHYGRMHKSAGLNLVSLMDIFTILVFFLMVNSSDVKVLQQDKSVKLPVSAADQQPKDTLVVMLSGKDILVQGRKVSAVSDNPGQDVLSGLKDELDYQSKRASAPQADQPQGLPITIVGDQGVPYSELKRIMATCVAAGYTNISLAVSHRSEKEV
ncbi:MAG: biopolymer transporter ExbD [Hahellaceae bacterium]|nr:biopolymer transporter ExbD [Hahellaceae bacterium]